MFFEIYLVGKMLSGNMKNGQHSLFSFRDMKAQTLMFSKNAKLAKNRLSPETRISLESFLLDESE